MEVRVRRGCIHLTVGPVELWTPLVALSLVPDVLDSGNRYTELSTSFLTCEVKAVWVGRAKWKSQELFYPPKTHSQSREESKSKTFSEDDKDQCCYHQRYKRQSVGDPYHTSK